jgi:hypothetical protein
VILDWNETKLGNDVAIQRRLERDVPSLILSTRKVQGFQTGGNGTRIIEEGFNGPIRDNQAFRPGASPILLLVEYGLQFVRRG